MAIMSNKICRQLLILTAALVLLACSNDVKIARLPAGTTILAFGDSLTTGVGVNKADSYPSVLATLTGLNVVGLRGNVWVDIGISG